MHVRVVRSAFKRREKAMIWLCGLRTAFLADASELREARVGVAGVLYDSCGWTTRDATPGCQCQI